VKIVGLGCKKQAIGRKISKKAKGKIILNLRTAYLFFPFTG
jgi:ribosomal protein S9